MPKPTDSIFMRVAKPVLGCPAKPGQVILIQDDWPKRRLTVRVGDRATVAGTEPVGFLAIAFLRGIVGNAAESDDEIYTSVTIDLDKVRRRWRAANREVGVG